MKNRTDLSIKAHLLRSALILLSLLAVTVIPFALAQTPTPIRVIRRFVMDPPGHGSATWFGLGTGGEWDYGDNWAPQNVPSGCTDVATFSLQASPRLVAIGAVTSGDRFR